jgi:hypothetical protein
VFYTGTIGAGALAPALYGVVGDALGVSTTLLVVVARAAHASAFGISHAGAGTTQHLTLPRLARASLSAS